MYTPLTSASRRAAKRQVVDNTPMRIGAIDFGIMSQDEIERQSQIEVSDRNLYDLDIGRNPTANGPLDLKLGTSSKVAICKTCHQEQRSCNGHWGFVRLEAACFHIGFLAFTIEVLNQICKSCSRVLLSEPDRRAYLKSLRRPNLDSFQRRLILRRLQADCKKIRKCAHCDSSNGPVRKVPGHACKLVHLKFEFYHKSTAKNKKAPPDKERFDAILHPYTVVNTDNARHVKKAVDDLPAVKVHRLFCGIPTEDCELLGLDLKKGRPESYLWTHLPVPPPNIRPSVPGDQGTTEDELTTKLSEIIDLNTRLRVAIENEEHMSIQMDYYEKLQDHIAMYINSHAPGLNKSEYGKAIRSFCSRLKGKQGRFRGNLSGKRVNFSGRTVISPDPNLSIEEVGIPKHVCKILSFPQTVNDNKIARESLRKAIMNGPYIWPGANGIKKKNGLHISLKVSATLGDTFVNKIIKELENGDIVHRHLVNDDVVLFNRQPSLHKLSVLCHRVRPHDSRTFRFNESVCNPYNADFDGDEMNIHVPQTEEARAEALELMGVKHNLVTPKNGAPIIAPIQDFITASYLLSLKDLFFNKAQFSQIIGWMFDAQVFRDPITGELQGYELPPPSIMKPMFLWTGKQVFNVMIRPSRKSNVLINLEARLREYKPIAGVAPDMCLEDGYLVIRNSEIMCGKMDKKAIGDGNKSSLFSVLLRDYGTDYAVQCMNRLAKLSARWLAHQGFSIGIGDVYPSKNLQVKKQILTTTAEAAVNELIVKFSRGALERDAGCDAEQTLENKISKILSDVRNDAGAVCFEELSAHNAAVIMAKSGSKGSMINVSQMTAGVGQQMIGGARVENGFQDRTLPHFKKGARDSASKGFVSSSFFSGLNPTEFIFHAMSGREGLVDTAVKTAETGYMSRRLIKSLEDAYVVYDNTIRNSSGKIIQFCFGDDRLDPAELEGDKQPINFERTWQHAIETEQNHNDAAMLPTEVMEAMHRALAAQLKKFIPGSQEDIVKVVSNAIVPDSQVDSDQAYRKFIKDIHDFIEKRALRLESLRIHYRIDEEDEAPNVDQHPGPKASDVNQSNDIMQVDPVVEPEESAPSRRGGRKAKRGGRGGAKGRGKAAAKPEKAAHDEAVVERQDEEPAMEIPKVEAWERMSPAQRKQRAVDNVLKFTPAILNTFLQLCWTKYTKSIAQPAHAVGAIAAQSIGEPGTQMTLKTFHFAGVAGMSITGGVPRIKEIINAAKKISTPVISCALENKYSEQAARYVKSRIEKTYLREIARYVEDEWSPSRGMLRLHIDMQRVSALQLDLTLDEIIDAIHRTKGLKLARGDVMIGGGNIIRIIPKEESADEVDEMDIDGYASEEEAPAARGRGRRPKRRAGPGSYYQSLQELRRSILGVVVKGYPETARAIIRRSENTNAAGEEELELLVEGYGLKACMNTEGVRGRHTKTNSVMETCQVLGVEAARSVIISEIQKVMESMDIDDHHIHLLACIMTLKGEVLGITRFGMAKMGDSVLQLASFEKTPDHLFEAATKMKSDPISGVSESIIMGQTVKLGTGMASVFRPLGLDEHVGEKEPVFWTSWKEKRVAMGWGTREWEVGNRLKTAVAAAPIAVAGA